MFEETINSLRQSRSSFEDKVQDSFGRSINDKVFDPTDNELGRLEGAYNEAELKKREIQAITLELRTIL